MKGISLSSVIQVINLERQSCDIEARVDGQRGELHFRDGALVDAVAEGLAGEEAAYEILAWQDPEFEVDNEDSPRDRTIEADLTQMLLEIARRQDEEKEESRSAAAAEDPVPPQLDWAESSSGSPLMADVSSAPDTPTALDAEPFLSASDAPPSPPPAAPSIAAPAPSPAAADRATESAPVGAPVGAPAAAAGPGALNAAGLKRVVQLAQDGIGDALLSADLFSSADGTSYVGVNSRPAVCALVNQVTERMLWAFDKGGLPPLGRYYTAELAGSRMLLVAPCGSLQLVLVVDTARVQLGLLLNVVLPEVLAALEEVSLR
jgi:hypothetical protein